MASIIESEHLLQRRKSLVNWVNQSHLKISKQLASAAAMVTLGNLSCLGVGQPVCRWVPSITMWVETAWADHKSSCMAGQINNLCHCVLCSAVTF